MANLTGEYDVVVEAGVGLLNGVLGAVHQNQDPAYPTMPHSLDLFVDDRPRGASDPVPASERTGITSRMEVQASTPILSLPVDTLTVRPEVLTVGEGHPAPTSGGPEGPAEIARTALGPLGGVFRPPTRFGLPRVTARVRLRAWVRDPTDGRLPEFLDGDLFVTTTLVRTDVPGAGTFVTLDRTSGPVVAFQPAPGTVATDEQRQLVAGIVRNVIRGDMDPPTFRVSLPPEVRRFDFELQPEARRPSVMLLLTLSDRIPGPQARANVGAGLIPDGADLAVGVGRDFIVDALRSRLFHGLPDRFHFSKLGVGVTIRPDWEGAGFELEAGRVVFSLTGDGDVSWWGIDDHFTFTVRMAFGLRVVDGGLEPFADGDPVVDLHDVAVGEGFIEGKARGAIKEQRDAVLAGGAGQLREAFDLRRPLEAILSSVHPGAPGVALTGVQIRPEGLVIPGTVALAASGPVVVMEASRGGLEDALQSWIPGGTVQRYVWRRFLAPPATARVEEHRFVTEPLTGGGIHGDVVFGGVCLTVEGTRVTAGGGLAAVSGGACFRFAPVLAQVSALVTAGPRPLLPLMDATVDGRLRVVGHYDPWAHGRAPSQGPTNLLVHVASDAGEAAGLLRGALAARKGDAAILAVGAVPAGGLGRLEASALDGEVLLVEDEGRRWAEAFGCSEAPATVLVGPRGEVVWREPGAITPAALARAIDRYAEAGGRIAPHPIGLAVRVNDRPPDLPLGLPDGGELSLRRLGGRPVVLAFWTPRSEPSVAHLELLRDLPPPAAGRDGDPLVVAVCDGEGPDRVAELVRDRRLPFLVLPDPDRRIARAFGVWCWPATVWVRADQRIEAIDLGTPAGPAASAAPAGPASYGP